MAYLSGWVRYVDGDERVDVGITVAKLVALLSTLPPDLLVRVSPITRDLVLEDGRWIDIANEHIGGSD